MLPVIVNSTGAKCQVPLVLSTAHTLYTCPYLYDGPLHMLSNGCCETAARSLPAFCASMLVPALSGTSAHYPHKEAYALASISSVDLHVHAQA